MPNPIQEIRRRNGSGNFSPPPEDPCAPMPGEGKDHEAFEPTNPPAGPAPAKGL